jgi:plastocyanin
VTCRRRRAVAVALASSLALLAAGCGDDGKGTATTLSRAPAKSAATIDIASFKFVPASVTVRAGASVTWVNRDNAPHTAENTGEKGPAQFNSGRLNTDQSKSVPFEKPGVYRYHCIYHRFMRASVTVVK